MAAADQQILDLSDLADLTPWSRSEMYQHLYDPDGERVTRDYTGLEACLVFPGAITVPVLRRAEGAGWVVYRRHLDRAVDAWEAAGRPMPPPPIAIEPESATR